MKVISKLYYEAFVSSFIIMLWYCMEIVLLVIYFPLYYQGSIIQNNSLLLGSILSTTHLVSLEKPRYQGVFFSFSFSFSTRCWSQEAKSGLKLASFGPKDSIIQSQNEKDRLYSLKREIGETNSLKKTLLVSIFDLK